MVFDNGWVACRIDVANGLTTLGFVTRHDARIRRHWCDAVETKSNDTEITESVMRDAPADTEVAAQ